MKKQLNEKDFERVVDLCVFAMSKQLERAREMILTGRVEACEGCIKAFNSDLELYKKIQEIFICHKGKET